MPIPEIDQEVTGSQLGAGGVDNLVTNAERICTYEQRRLELRNRGPIVSLQWQYDALVSEMAHLEQRLQMAPPPGDLRRLRWRAIYYWSTTTILIAAGFMFTLLTFEPFRLGWKSWVYSVGIAVVTPFVVEHLLNCKNMEKFIKALAAAAAVFGLAGLMLLAVIRGNLLAQEIHQDAAPVVVLDDSAPQPEQLNTFYDSTVSLLRVALLLIAFTMEVGAGLALREAWRSAPDSSQDWKALRKEHLELRQRMAEIGYQATMLRNEPEIFANRYWRDFYRALLSNAARSAMTKLLMVILGVSFIGASRAQAEGHLNLVVAIDLSQSVVVTGPGGKSEFQKNVDGVTHLLAQVPAGSHVTVVGITDHSFTQPYILLSARVPDDPGYFGERLSSARSQLMRAWQVRCTHLDSHFQRTDIVGALRLASEILAQGPDAAERMLTIFSDMRQNTSDLNLEAPQVVPSFPALAARCGTLPVLRNVHVYILGADGATKSTAYWHSLQMFWNGYFRNAEVAQLRYTVLRDLPQFPGGR